jgi:hypothetical protein
MQTGKISQNRKQDPAVMSDFAATSPSHPAALPIDKRARRLAITTLTNRGVANRRETDVQEALGPRDAALMTDYVAATTSEIAAQLLLTEHLLDAGWAWPDILRSVWYREEALREAATAGGL